MAWEPGGINHSICLSIPLGGTLEGRKKGEDGSMKVKEWKKEALDVGFKKEEGCSFPYEKQRGLQ